MKTNFSQPFGAQSLRLRQELRALWRGALAVPAKKRGGPALPLRQIAQVLHEAFAIRASRWEKFSPFVLCLSFLMLPLNAYAAQVTVRGQVIFEGMPQAVETVEVKSDVPTCGTTKEIKKIVLGEGQGVANAVVILHGAKVTVENVGAGLKLLDQVGAGLKPAPTLDQVNCEFTPHVQVLSKGSSLILTSSDPVLHNAHGFFEDGSTAFNIAVPIPGMEVSHKLNQAGMIKLRCDAGHTWMSAYIVVTDQPYYAMTDADGNFTIEGVPAGDYEIEVWQEWLGKHREPLQVSEAAQSVSVTLKGG